MSSTYCYLCTALQLRLQGNAEARGGDLKAAEQVYSQALDLDIPQGKHLLHANRAGVRLTLGNAAGALEDAQAAVKLAPPGFTTAYIRQVRCPALQCSLVPPALSPALPCPALSCSALPSTFCSTHLCLFQLYSCKGSSSLAWRICRLYRASLASGCTCEQVVVAFAQDPSITYFGCILLITMAS